MQQPCTARNSWPPNYIEVWQWRQNQIRLLKQRPELVAGAKIVYAQDPCLFINHWCDTYDPRNAGSEVPARMPFIMFPKQAELAEFLLAMIRGEENGLIEKSRDMGATWLCAAFSVWLWLFWEGSSVGWGSRKEQLVDKIGDPDSIFEKIRMIVKGLPKMFLPVGFNPTEHMTYMKMINPENQATITGEAGDNIGRGGRKLIYFKDESAHYQRPESIEAALSDTTRTQIDISSVCGLGNVFHRRRESGEVWTGGAAIKGRTNVFIMDWRDHPAKTQAWYDKRKAKAEQDGLMHVFAQEVDRNYSAAVQNVCIPAEWVKSAIDAHIKLGFDDSGQWVAALDVADEGGDKNALTKRKGSVLKYVDAWAEGDTGDTARRAIAECGTIKVELQYDCIGVGAGVKSEANRLKAVGQLPKGIKFIAWNAAASAQDPDGRVEKGDKESPKNKEFYANLKAQGWWELRRRFEKTHKAVTKGEKYNPDELISIPSDLKNLRQLEKELSQATVSRSASSMKMVIDKSPEGTKSPNMADSVVMAYWPIAGNYNLAGMVG